MHVSVLYHLFATLAADLGTVDVITGQPYFSMMDPVARQYHQPALQAWLLALRRYEVTNNTDSW